MFTAAYRSVLPKFNNFLFKLYSSAAKDVKKVVTPPVKSKTAGSGGAGGKKGGGAGGAGGKKSGGAGGKKGGGCNKKADPTKGKKGKMCGKPKPPPPPKIPGPPGGNPIVDKCERFEHHKSDTNKWRLVSYCLVPLALGFSAFVLATAGEHGEPDYIPYEFMYRRTKRFAWRDGRTSLFHGPNNLIPDEEEERIEREMEEEKDNTPPPKKGEPAPEKPVKYKKSVHEEDDKVQKREQHAEEELERRKRRHEKEAEAEASAAK